MWYDHLPGNKHLLMQAVTMMIRVDNIVTYLTSCHKLLALLLCVFLCHVLIQKWFARGEDTDPEQSTSSMALFLVLLPDSQFLCWSHSARVLVHVNKYGKKHFICLHHLGVSYSAPNKESTFSEILISAVKSTFSHSNHHKSIKELFCTSFLKICFSPYITHREAIEVQKPFLGKLSKFQQNEQYLRICMELRFQIWSTHTLT